MQRVAELVEQGAGVVEAEQGGIALREVRDVDDDRPDLAGELLLGPEGAHPGAAALRGPGEIVAEEQPDMPPVARHLPDAHVGMIARRVPDLGEVEPEEPPGGVEGRLDDALELEVGLDLGLVEVVLAAAQLLGVVAPVPRREREIAALLPHQLLQGVALAPGARHRRRPDIAQKLERRLRRLRHGVGELVGGEALIAHEPRPLGAQGARSRR